MLSLIVKFRTLQKLDQGLRAFLLQEISILPEQRLVTVFHALKVRLLEDKLYLLLVVRIRSQLSCYILISVSCQIVVFLLEWILPLHQNVNRKVILQLSHHCGVHELSQLRVSWLVPGPVGYYWATIAIHSFIIQLLENLCVGGLRFEPCFLLEFLIQVLGEDILILDVVVQQVHVEHSVWP